MHPVGAGLCSARSPDEISTSGQSRAPPPTTCPRKKVTSIKILIAPSIDGSCSKATSCKPDTSVSGGAYQDARKVSLVWNDSQKLGPHLNSEAGSTQTVTQRPFSPPSFPARRKRRGRRRRVRNDHDGTSRRKRRLLSSVLVSSFPNRKLNLRFGFYSKSATTSQSACG